VPPFYVRYFPFDLGAILCYSFIFILFPIFLGHLHRAMGCIKRKVSKEWFILIVFYERISVCGEVVCDKTISIYDLSIVLQYWIEVFSPVSSTESIKFTKASCIWMIGCLTTIMPFSKDASGIAIP